MNSDQIFHESGSKLFRSWVLDKNNKSLVRRLRNGPLAAKHVLETSELCNQIVTASNGEEEMKAIAEYYLKTNKLPVVIIVYLQMPRVDGLN